MGLFRKKLDPISEREKLLDHQIAALEAEIRKLSLEQEQEQEQEQEREKASHASPFAPSTPSLAPLAGPPAAGPTPPPPSSQPRLRSTALPHGLSVPAPNSPPPAEFPRASTQEPIFEDVNEERLQARSEAGAPSRSDELGVRKYDLTSAWQRFKNQFRGPPTSNPKLVHYLSAGSIQGLRPLRYEKRVARNRVIVLAAFVVLVLWGLIAIFISRR